MMFKYNLLSKSLFIVIPITLFFAYKVYGYQINKNEPNNYSELNNYTELPEFDLNGENYRDEVSELNSLLSVMKKSLDSLNEKIDTNKQASEKRMKLIEASIKEIVAERDINQYENIDDPVLSHAEESQNYQELAIEQMNIFNEALAEEERDEGWATGMEDTILVASQNEMYYGSIFTSPLCKSTFCQVEAYHTDADSRDNFENIRREIPNSFHIQHFEESGELKSVIYFIKRGEEPNNIIFNTMNGASGNESESVY